jgi:DNA-directed RNA polymerase specialized sigma24 family protein
MLKLDRETTEEAISLMCMEVCQNPSMFEAKMNQFVNFDDSLPWWKQRANWRAIDILRKNTAHQKHLKGNIERFALEMFVVPSHYSAMVHEYMKHVQKVLAKHPREEVQIFLLRKYHKANLDVISKMTSVSTTDIKKLITQIESEIGDINEWL